MAASFVIETPIGAQVASATQTAQGGVPLNYYARGYDNQTAGTSKNVGAGVFVYCRGSNVSAAGQFVMLSQSIGGGGASAVLLDSVNSRAWWPIGVAAGNLSATNVFGWVQVQGIADYCLVSNTSVAAGTANLCLGSTAGQVGSVTALGSRIAGMAVPVSFTSSQTSLTVYLDYPKLIGITASN